MERHAIDCMGSFGRRANLAPWRSPGKPSRSWWNKQLFDRNLPMKNFVRIVRMALERRLTFLAVVATSLGVAFFWGGNLALIKPVVEIVFTYKSPHALADQKVVDARAKLAATEDELLRLTVNLWSAPPEKQTALKIRRDRFVQQEAADQYSLRAAFFIRPLVQRFLPDSTFLALALFLAFFITATLLKDVMLVANLVLVERLSQLAMLDMRNRLFRKTLQMEMAHFGEGHS